MTPMITSTAQTKPDAYLIGNSIILDFPKAADNVSISLVNNDTGEVIHHEIFSSKKAATISIELIDCYSGKYSIDVNSDEENLKEAFNL